MSSTFFDLLGFKPETKEPVIPPHEVLTGSPPETVKPLPGNSTDIFTGAPPETAAPTGYTGKAPTLEMPGLNLSEGSSVTNQLNALNSKDSLRNQQALVTAHERGVASGGIHSSQQAGAAQRALDVTNQELAESEAGRPLTQDMANFGNKTTEALTAYGNQYTEHLQKMGYDQNTQNLMAQLNTSLSNAFLASMTSMTNNMELDMGPELMARFENIFNTAMDNNNLTLDMGFTY